MFLDILYKELYCVNLSHWWYLYTLDFFIAKTLYEEANFNRDLYRQKLLTQLNNFFIFYTSAYFPTPYPYTIPHNPYPMKNDRDVIKRSGESELVNVTFILNSEIFLSLEVPSSNFIFLLWPFVILWQCLPKNTWEISLMDQSIPTLLSPLILLVSICVLPNIKWK